MAFILKENETFRPTMSNSYGVDILISSAYAIVDSIEVDRIRKELSIGMVIYSSEEARGDSNMSPIDRVHTMVIGDEFDAIMSASCLVTACYNSVKESFPSFESDEE